VIPLSHKTDSKYLYFLLNSDTYSKPGLSAPLRLSSASKVERQLARHIIEFVSIGFIFFLIALISFVAALHIQADRKKPLSYAVLAITAGLYLLVNADLSRQIIEIPHLLSWYVSMVTFYSFPIGMFAFLEYTLDRPLKQVNRVLWRLHLAFAIIAVSLEALGILEYMFLLPYFLMLLSVSITLNLFLSLPVFFVRGKENGSTSRLNRKIITLGGIIFFSTVTHDILATFRFIHSGRSFFHVGLLVFTLFLAYILLRNYIDADIKLREYSRELTRKSNQLEEYSHNLEEKVRDRTRELQQNIALLEKEISLRAEVESRLIKHETELEKLNATKDRFFSIIAHDLRNPFNSIIGMSHLIVQQSENLGKKEIIDSVQDIHSSSILVYKLLENLLEWSRLQRGVIKPQPENLHVIDYINEALSIHRNMIHNKDINVKLEIEEGIKVYGDGNMLRTILRNLISNAIKFTPRGGSITLASVIDGQNVVLSISDTGAGIPPEVLPRLFDIDRQHTTKGTEKETGSGLGLILCREFIEKMEGSIMVTSEIDEGSVFKILLPAGTEG
jgi:signal transduction histidine kinase